MSQWAEDWNRRQLLHFRVCQRSCRTPGKVVRPDFNQQYTIAVEKRVQHELNSTLICTEVSGVLKGEGQNRERVSGAQ